MEQEKKYRIKDLTWEYHKNAERQDFVRLYYRVILMKNYMQLIFIIN